MFSRFRWLLAFVLVLNLHLGAWAQDNRSNLADRMRKDNYRRDAIVFERLVETELSPQWWARINDTKNDQYSAYTALRCYASVMMNFAKNMGWGDLGDIDYKNGYDGSSPLLGQTVDEWKSKTGLKIVLLDEPKPADVAQAVTNLSYLSDPIQNDEYNHPRSGKIFIKLQLDCKLSKAKYVWDKSLTNLTVSFPSSQSVDQSEMREALKKVK